MLLAISSPRAGESLARSTPNDSVSVSVDYWGPSLVAGDGAHAIDDDHLVYLLDQHVVHAVATRATFDCVAHGSHVLAVLLVGSNNVSVQPPVAASVTFTVT